MGRYPLPGFVCNDLTKLVRVVEAYPLATLITAKTDRPLITQIPLYLEGGKLYGHMDVNNPHAAALIQDPEVTCLFHGPNHYISPTVYPDQQYPGWNYVTARIEAQARPLDASALKQTLFELAKRCEPENSGYVLRAEQRNFDLFASQITGFEFAIVRAEGIFKLAQDKGATHAELARRHLASLVRPDPADLLKELLS